MGATSAGITHCPRRLNRQRVAHLHNWCFPLWSAHALGYSKLLFSLWRNTEFSALAYLADGYKISAIKLCGQRHNNSRQNGPLCFLAIFFFHMLINDQMDTFFITEELNLITTNFFGHTLLQVVLVICVSLIALYLIPCQVKICWIHRVLDFRTHPQCFLGLPLSSCSVIGLQNRKGNAVSTKQTAYVYITPKVWDHLPELSWCGVGKGQAMCPTAWDSCLLTGGSMHHGSEKDI